MSNDWLELPGPEPEPALTPAVRYTSSGQRKMLEALMDDTSPPTHEAKDLVKIDPDYRKAILALRRATPKQRTFIRAFLQEKTKAAAIRLLKSKGIPIDQTTVWRWERDSDYLTAMQHAKNAVLRMCDIDPVSLQIKAGKVLEDAMEPKDVLDREGNPTGFQEINHNAAMRAVEWLGKVNRMTQDEAARVTLEIINLSGDEDPPADFIDVTPEQNP